MLLKINALVYLIFGVAFVAFPQTVAAYLVQTGPAAPDAITDMRSMYGGMCTALAIVFWHCSQQKELYRQGTQLLFVLTSGLLLARIVGLFIEGFSSQMLLFSALELAVVLLAYRNLTRS